MSKNDKKGVDKLWDNIPQNSFDDETVESSNIAEYNLEKQKLFIANINYSRQMPKLMDGLKTVERRLLYSIYNMKLTPGNSAKCNTIIGEVSKIHVHGEQTAYKALVGMAQYWKRGIRLIKGIGNFGNAAMTEGYAASRYTEASLSKFSKECFFDDFDIDCIDMIPSSLVGEEPVQLPAKFPNILINGGVGIAVGNKLGIPAYHVDDIYNLFKRLMQNPDHKNIYIYPELPTGCDIVDDGRSLKEICETGTGVLRMRSRIDIEEGKNSYILKVRNLPWFVSLEKVNEKIVELAKSGKIPIKDIQNNSVGYRSKGEIKTYIDYNIIISKAQDPYVIRDMLFKNTELASSLSIQFKIVTEDLYIGNINMRDLVLTWLDERREYKRRLFNKKISKNKARLSLLDILIDLLSEDNISKTMRIIRNNTKSNAIDALVSDYGMNSYQASKIVEMPLITFTSDARERFMNERKELEDATEVIMQTVKSKKKIDEIILMELSEMKKYGRPKECRIISASEGKTISETDHIIVITKRGLIKKLPIKSNKNPNGTFLQGDYPIHRFECNNLDSIMLFDSNGRYSIVPMSNIKNTDFNNAGYKIYDIAGLDGEIVLAIPYINDDFQRYMEEHKLNMNIVSLTKSGYIKRTEVNELKIGSNVKNSRYSKVKSGDEVVYAEILFDKTGIVIYSKKGQYGYIKISDLTPLSKDSQGVLSIPLKDNDECSGCCAIGNDTEYIILLTEKGNMKRITIDSLGDFKKRRQSSYISNIAEGDSLLICDSVKENSKLMVCNKNGFTELGADDIPILSRRALPQKIISVPLGDNIIDMKVEY